MVRVDTDRLVGVAELAAMLGVARTTISNWYDRRDRNGFPEPVIRLSMGPVWDSRAVLRWYGTYTPRRGAKVGRVVDRDKRS